MPPLSCVSYDTRTRLTQCVWRCDWRCICLSVWRCKSAGFGQNVCPEIGCRGLFCRACRGFRILMPPLSSPAGMCVRNRRGPVAAQGVQAVGMCPGRACHDIRRAPDGRLPALSGSHTAGLCMPGHARTAKHGASTAVSRRYPFSFACHGIQDAHTTRAAIKTSTHPTSRHTYWPITPGFASMPDTHFGL